MTKKFYRLADTRDVGKKIILTDNIGFIYEHKVESYQSTLEETTIDLKDRDRIMYFGKNTDGFNYAFIEITPDDFTDEQIKAEHEKRFEDGKKEDTAKWVDAEWPRDEDKRFLIHYKKDNEIVMSVFRPYQVRADSVVDKVETVNICNACKKETANSGITINGVWYCSKECYESTLYREPVNEQDRLKECEVRDSGDQEWVKANFLCTVDFDYYRFKVIDKYSTDLYKFCRIRKDA